MEKECCDNLMGYDSLTIAYCIQGNMLIDRKKMVERWYVPLFYQKYKSFYS